MASNNQDQAGDLLIQEVDEDLKQEYYLKLWRAYGKYAVIAVALVVLGVGGHQAWLGWRADQFQKRAAQYGDVQRALAEGKTESAMAGLQQIAGSAGGFGLAAAFQQADLLAKQNQLEEAAARYDQIAAGDAPSLYRDLAVIKASLLRLDKDDPALLALRLQALIDLKNPYHATATELLAVLALRRGLVDQAKSYYKQLADDLTAPQNIRARAAEMLASLGNKSEKG